MTPGSTQAESPGQACACMMPMDPLPSQRMMSEGHAHRPVILRKG